MKDTFALPQTTELNAAWQVTRYGSPDVLAPVTRPIPQPVGREVLVRIRASAVTRADMMMRSGTPRWTRPFLGWSKPRNDLSGFGFSGEVIATGPFATRFRPGDQVFGETGLTSGANATHIVLDETGTLMPKPEALGHDEAAVMADGPLTSLNFLRNLAGLKRGERVLILGGAGSLGSAAIQIAAAMGAEVTASASARNRGLLASLGATRVIDYTAEEPLAHGRYDVIYDTIGVETFARARRVLAPGGRYVSPVLTLGLLGAMLRSRFGTRRAYFDATGLRKPEEHRRMLADLLDMVAEGTLAPVMDRSYPLADLPIAQAYVETGHKRGNVVVMS
ncbi:NAD(P)-dependent alcohol dehydrogenase [Mesobacterium pallidum]|uniref:NAD(P)-dependent alcohol dehydrogenase n=1 Tax=Mesobacterium pallidum TaxID=2872037 RepID=UPI001EE396FF|nr:NAD(P)-dependent alcohol dehydrogenase [Mesobacterium pallidum]